jgi:hypothetical protein
MKKVNKVSSTKGMADCCYSPTISVEFAELDEIAEVALGETVRMVIKGKVKSLDQREDYDNPKVTHASITIRDFTATLVNDTTQFDSLLEDEDEGD